MRAGGAVVAVVVVQSELAEISGQVRLGERARERERDKRKYDSPGAQVTGRAVLASLL